jgi:hypothetical protein
MNEYLIGAGALLTAGPESSIAGATLHAQTDALLAGQVRAALVDFEAADPEELSRIVIMATGWRRARFDAEVIQPLTARRECSLADVVAALASATGESEVHLFARWLPGAAMAEDLRARGIGLIAHPLDAIDQAALVTGQRFARWKSALRAA